MMYNILHNAVKLIKTVTDYGWEVLNSVGASTPQDPLEG